MDKTNTDNWILIRGLVRSRYHWFGFEKLIQREFNTQFVQCTELPGNGFLNHELSPINLAEAVEIFRQQINIAELKQVNLITISLGSMIGLKWAELYPNEILSLTIINTSSVLSPFYQRLRPENYLAFLSQIINRNVSSLEKLILNLTVNTNKKESVLNPYIQFHKSHSTSLKNFFRQIYLANDEISYTKIEITPLILVSKNDRLVNSKCSYKIAEIFKTTVLEHPTAGHDLTLDDPEWVISKIKNSMH